jgi:hypothetical protein
LAAAAKRDDIRSAIAVYIREHRQIAQSLILRKLIRLKCAKTVPPEGG